MNDILRTFRLGVINLLGVTLPGLMLLLLLGFGSLFPATLLLNDASSRLSAKSLLRSSAGTNQPAKPMPTPILTNSTPALSTSQTVFTVHTNLPPICQLHPSAVIAIVLILAYVVGYVFRLSTPDDLDEKSTKIVLAKMEDDRTSVAQCATDNSKQRKSAAEEDHWPHRGEKGNKFPYFHFKDYLYYREHHDLLDHVKWSQEKRSKTFVNRMKLETALRCPQLSAVIESNEAHIRMLFGTWLACRLGRWFVPIGLVASVIGCLWTWTHPVAENLGDSLLLAYTLWVVITLLVLGGTLYAKDRIEGLFHYRRVRELFDVVVCYHLALEGFDRAGRPRGFRKNANTGDSTGELEKSEGQP